MPSKRKIAANKRREEKRRRKAARRQYILCLVEGNSEVKALEAPLGALIDALDGTLDVRFQVMYDRHRKTGWDERGGDVTSKYGVTPSTIEHVIEKTFLTPFFRTSGLYPTDVLRVVHLVDTDGAFVPDDLVLPAPAENPRLAYRDGHIYAPDVDKILSRNAQKRDNLRKLASLSQIKADSKTVPYNVFFFSSNLDHFLYGEPNLSSMQKEAKADAFSLECCMRPSVFYDMLHGDDLFGQLDYETSWQLVQIDDTSLQRHSNLATLFGLL